MGVPNRSISVAGVLLGVAVLCFDAALWLPCLSEAGVADGRVYSGAHLIFVAVGSLFSLVSSAWVTEQTLEAWWLLPVANVVFLAAPWIWTSHPRSKMADHAVKGMKIATGLAGVWAVGNLVLAHTGLWAEPMVQEMISLLPGAPWQLEYGALFWIGSMVCVTAALIRRRDDQRQLLARWEARPGAASTEQEPTSDQLAGLPAGIRSLVIDAHRLRLEFDAMGPIDEWRVRLIGDWVGHLCLLQPGDYAFLAQQNIWPQQLTLSVTPDPRTQGAQRDRLAELMRIDEALHHFCSAVLGASKATYR
jgi:hypothetical protein